MIIAFEIVGLIKHMKYQNVRGIFPDVNLFFCEVCSTVQEIFGGTYVDIFSGKIL
jgi:hypothetical protein